VLTLPPLLMGIVGAVLLTASHQSPVQHPFCDCGDTKPSVQQAYESAEMVIEGEIVSEDSIQLVYAIDKLRKRDDSSNIGYRKRIASYTCIKVRVVTNFKSAIALPDTITVLRMEPPGCGYPFPYFIPDTEMPENFYRFIIYGMPVYEEIAEPSPKKNRYKVHTIKSSNTFGASFCSRTRRADSTERAALLKLRQ